MPASDPLHIPELLLALMSLLCMAALLKLANSAAPGKECSSSREWMQLSQHVFTTQIAVSVLGEEVVWVVWLD